MRNDDFLKDVCPNHTDKSKWNKSEVLYILDMQKKQFISENKDVLDPLKHGLENQKENTQELSVVDIKIKQLLELTDEFIFPASYSHTNDIMWKITNIYTQYKSETLVLCSIDEGIESALDIALVEIKKKMDDFYGKS